MNFKNLIKLILIFILFYFIKYVQYIPVYLFNMDLSNLSGEEEVFLNLFSNLCLLLILLFIYRKDLVKYYNKLKGKRLITFNSSLKYYILGIFLMIISNVVITILFKGGGANNEKTVQEMITASPILMFINAALIAPVTEELTFRKTYMDAFPDKELFVTLSALMFGLAHVISSSSTIFEFLYFIPYSCLGLAFALMDKESDNVLPSIFFHMMHNGLLTILSSII